MIMFNNVDSKITDKITNAGNKTAGSTALNNANGFHIDNHEVFLENSKTLNTQFLTSTTITNLIQEPAISSVLQLFNDQYK